MALRRENCQKQDTCILPITGGKIEDIKENVSDLLHEELQKVIIPVGTNNAMTDTPKWKTDIVKTPNQEYSAKMWG